MRCLTTLVAAIALLIAFPVACAADDSAPKAAIQKKLESEYALTKTTADKSDIVTAGSVLVLQKDKLLMVAANSSANPCPNTYKDGKVSPNAGCKAGDVLRRLPGFGSHVRGADKAPATRTFVSGEKFWVTKIDTKETGNGLAVTMDFFSDAISDVRYRGSLTIPLNSATLSPEDALKIVHEVVTVAPSDDAKGEAKNDAPPSQPDQQAQAAPSETAVAPIAPPPPPPDAPEAPTVSLGQTPDQVVAELGQPIRKSKVGAKEIYFYKDVRVSFVNGKVKDIQ